MANKKTVYIPVLEPGRHLDNSRVTPGRVRGISRNQENKDIDIPEWEEEEIEERTTADDVRDVIIIIVAYKTVEVIYKKFVPWVRRKYHEHKRNRENNRELECLPESIEVVETFENLYCEEDHSDIEVQKLLIENYLLMLRIAMNNRKLAERGIACNNERLYELVENEEICNRLNLYLVENGEKMDKELWQMYNTLFSTHPLQVERGFIDHISVRKMIAG